MLNKAAYMGALGGFWLDVDYMRILTIIMQIGLDILLP